MGQLKNILVETKRLVEDNSAEQMQYIKVFASANPEKYKELIDWAGMEQEYQKQLLDYVSAWSNKHWEGSLNLDFIPIDDLGQLQTVSKNLSLRYSDLPSLGQLQSVGGTLDLWKSTIKDLGQLQTVGDVLELYNATELANLGTLQTVGHTLGINKTGIESLGQVRSIGKILDATSSLLSDLGQLQTVGSSMMLIDTPLAETHTKEQIRQQVEVGDIIFDIL